MSVQPEPTADRVPEQPESLGERRSWILPKSVAHKLSKRQAGTFAKHGSFDIGEASDTFHVAAWMAAVGWEADDFAGAILEREKKAGANWGTSRLTPRVGDLGRHADDILNLGRYLVFGTIPPVPTQEPDEQNPNYRQRVVVSWARQAFRDPKVLPTGAPRIGRSDLDPYLDEVLDAFGREPQSGTSRSDRAVLLVALGIARAACTVVPVLAVRRVAELANLNKKTAGKALARLQAYGFLRPFGARKVATGQAFLIRARSHQAYSYIVTEQSPVCRPNTNCMPDETLAGSHPAFHSQGHGQTALALLRALRSSPKTDSEWMAAGMVKRAAFYRHKKSLTGRIEGLPALAVKNADGWHLVPADRLIERLDEHARYFGTNAMVDRRNATMAVEQDGYRRFLLRHIATDFDGHDGQRAVDRQTGALIAYSDLVDFSGTPKDHNTANDAENGAWHRQRQEALASAIRQQETLSGPSGGAHDEPEQNMPKPSDDHRLSDNVQMMDTQTGTLVRLHHRTGHSRRANQATTEPTCPLMATYGMQVRTRIPVTVQPSESVAVETSAPPQGRCVCCGYRTTFTEPTTGWFWHYSCRMPHWIARKHRQDGLTIPEHLDKYPTVPADFDPYDIDPDHSRIAALSAA